MKQFLLYVISLSVAVMFGSCKTSTGPSPDACDCVAPEANAVVKMLSSFEGKTFKTGESVTICFSVDVLNTTGAVLECTRDGREWIEIVENSLFPTKTTGFECFTHTWVIPSDFVDAKNTTIQLKVRDYNDRSKKDISGTFTIIPQ